MLWGPRHRGVMAQRAGALCRIDPADNRLVGWTVIDPAGVDGGDLTVGNGVGWFRGTEAWSPRSTPRADGSSGGSDPARAVAAPAPGSCGSRPMTFPSRTEYPCWRAGPGVSRQAQQSILERSGRSRTLVVGLRVVAASRPPFPRPRRRWRRTTSVRRRACIWCPHSRAAARPGCPRPGSQHRSHRRAGTTIAPAYGLARGGCLMVLRDRLGQVVGARFAVVCHAHQAIGPRVGPKVLLGVQEPQTHGARHVGGTSPWRPTTRRVGGPSPGHSFSRHGTVPSLTSQTTQAS
jgi:hypothetical protein